MTEEYQAHTEGEQCTWSHDGETATHARARCATCGASRLIRRLRDEGAEAAVARVNARAAE